MFNKSALSLHIFISGIALIKGARYACYPAVECLIGLSALECLNPASNVLPPSGV